MVEEEKYKIAKNIVFDTLNDDMGLIIDSKNYNAYEVTETVCSILKYISKNKIFEKIKQQLVSEYEVDEKTAEKDLKEILEELLKNKIIEKV